jgi:UDP-glucose:(heptosyl)LPS alpha-1,3-glucosyltransferase
MLAALVARGHEVHVLSQGPQAPIPALTVHRLHVPPLPRAARVLATVAVVRARLARDQWDVVQSHERTLGQDVYRAGEGCHRAYLDARPPGTPVRGAYHRIMLSLERRIFIRTPGIVAIARHGKAEIEQHYGVSPARVTVVYNGVDLERFHPRNRAHDRAAARADVGVSIDAPLALFVGSGFERKGLRTAIEAFAALDDRSTRLLVIGKDAVGPYRALASRLGVDDRIGWLGPQQPIERWYAAADVLVLPTWYEPFGNVHLEALASGLPVVTSTRAGGAEIVEDGVTGAVREPGDPKAIAEALRPILDRRRPETVDRCRHAAEPFTYERQAEGLEAIYRHCARKR